MMNINLHTQKNVKDFARRVSEYMKKRGTNVTFDHALEAISFGLGYGSWNEACAALPKDQKSGQSDTRKVVEAAPKAMPMPQSIPNYLSVDDPEQERRNAFALGEALKYQEMFSSGKYKPIVIDPNAS